MVEDGNSKCCISGLQTYPHFSSMPFTIYLLTSMELFLVAHLGETALQALPFFRTSDPLLLDAPLFSFSRSNSAGSAPVFGILPFISGPFRAWGEEMDIKPND